MKSVRRPQLRRPEPSGEDRFGHHPILSRRLSS
jgi:hypothetical protein